MSINVRWLDEEQRVIIYDMHGSWSWQMLFEAIEQAANMMDTVSQRIDVILDMRNSPTTPTFSPIGLRGLIDARTTSHRNMGDFHVVGASQMVRVMHDIFMRMYPSAGERYILCQSMTDAEACIGKKQGQGHKA